MCRFQTNTKHSSYQNFLYRLKVSFFACFLSQMLSHSLLFCSRTFCRLFCSSVMFCLLDQHWDLSISKCYRPAMGRLTVNKTVSSTPVSSPNPCLVDTDRALLFEQLVCKNQMWQRENSFSSNWMPYKLPICFGVFFSKHTHTQKKSQYGLCESWFSLTGLMRLIPSCW